MTEIKHFTTILQWADKSRDFYGFEKIHYEYESFDIDLSEQYHISFSDEKEVKIEIFRDLNEYANKIYSNEKEREIWIDKEIENIIKTLKMDLKSILTIVKRSVKSQKISINFVGLPAITIFEKHIY